MDSDVQDETAKATYTQVFEGLPDSIRPLLQIVDVRKLVQSVAKKDLPLFLRLLGTAEITAGPESTPSAAKEEMLDQTRTSQSTDGKENT